MRVGWKLAEQRVVRRATTGWDGRTRTVWTVQPGARAGERLVVSVVADYLGQRRSRDLVVVVRPAAR